MTSAYFDQDTELRLWYTGITRTKHNLHIVQNQSPYHVYDLLTNLLRALYPAANIPGAASPTVIEFEDDSDGPPMGYFESHMETGILRPFLGDGGGEK